MKLFAEYSRELNWWLKQCLSYSPALRRKLCIKSSDTVVEGFSRDQLVRYQQLNESYALDDWPRLCSRIEFIENLYLLDLLDQHVGVVKTDGVALDIGCRNFSHLPALSAFMRQSWYGVELDANARYWNSYTRRAYGEWMAKQREGCRYIPGSLLKVEGSYIFISWILPFVVEAPLQRWGLPARFFQPEQLLAKACSLLANDGVMLIVNQGAEEAEVQQRLFSMLKIEAEPLGELDSLFSPFRNTRFGWLVRR